MTVLTCGYSWEQIMKDDFLEYSKISLKQAFYIIAGGIRIQFLQHDGWAYLDDSDNFWDLRDDDGERRRDLQKLLLELHHNFLDEKIIDAHSHIDILSKVVTWFQSAWTGVQIIARLAGGLNISLLEVVTAGYILLALLTVLFWAEKPYNIGLCSEAQIHVDLPTLPSQSLARTTTDREKSIRPGNRLESNEKNVPGSHDQNESESDEKQGSEGNEKSMPDKENATEHVKEGYKRSYRAVEHIVESLLESAKKESNIKDPFRLPYVWWVPDRFQFAWAIFLATLPWLALTGVHLAAWRYPFPTNVEAWFWRASTIHLFVGPLCYAFEVSYLFLFEGKYPFFEAVSSAVMALSVLIYFIARTFIMIEPFISLRWAPAGIYDNVNWTSYWGHIGG